MWSEIVGMILSKYKFSHFLTLIVFLCIFLFQYLLCLFYIFVDCHRILHL